jgi:hypothetical protein
MTDVSPETQALIDAAILQDRAAREHPNPVPAPAITTSSPAVAATLGRRDDFDAAMEALKRPTTVEFHGLHFQVEPADAWLVDFTELLNQGRVRTALIMAIGEGQYDHFMALQPRPGMIDHLALANRVAEVVRSGDL